MNFVEVAEQWQKRWEKAKLFDAKPSRKKKYFITFPYPYVNGAPHIGHSFSAFRVDALARFKRMQGYNVLFPQAFHATGEPIVGLVKRLKEGNEVMENSLKRSGAASKDIEKFKADPVDLILFYAKRWEMDLRKGGLSIDWSRKFITTTITPTYSRFVEWQYNTLRKKGYVTQGTHPVVWCPKDKSPTGDHDRLEGEGESPIEYIVLKFQFEDSYLPAATLRPETIYGVTNIWIDPDAEYVKIDVCGEKWIVSKSAAKKLYDQIKDMHILGNVTKETLFSKRAIAPVTNRYVPILPARFVDPDSATGVVMSVPSHAPYDWIALKEMVKKNKIERYGVLSNEMEPISVVKSELGDHPAIEICEEIGIDTTDQKRELDKATNIVYKKEFHSGVLNEKCGPYRGMRVADAKDKIKMDFIEKNVADIMYDISDVVCRCGTTCHIKILENQWFLTYSDIGWKKKAKKCLSTMNIFPSEARNNLENTIDWLNDKACARRSGLGTPLPWDKEWIVETLSDSTIYMAYYTISRIIKEEKIKEKQLTDDVFDFVFSGIGDIEKIAFKTNIKKSVLEAMQKEFNYFYPVDMRNSGKDLVQNHLTFYIFHHTALWQKDKWPRGISVNGMVNVEGEKMSKSKGNVLPVRDLMEHWGPDIVRINILASAEGIDDPDWRVETIKGYKTRIEFLCGLTENLAAAKSKRMGNPEKYLQSVLQKIIVDTTEGCGSAKFRSSIQSSLFDATNSLKWYLKRVNGIENANKSVLKNSLSVIIRLLSPIIPHVCEELWNRLGNKNFVSVAEWPKYDKNLIDKGAELSEDFLRAVIKDLEDVKKLVKINPKKATIFFADDWKFVVYNKMLSSKGDDIENMMDSIMKTDLRRYGKATLGFMQYLKKKIDDIGEIPGRQKQILLLRESEDFIKKETGLDVLIEDASKSECPKANSAMPHKPGILLE